MKTSPFAPKKSPQMPEIKGVQLAVTKSGIKYEGRLDLLCAHFSKGTVAAGTLTKSKTASGAVEWCRENLKRGHAAALIVNSGNANAFTGARGEKSVEDIGGYLAKILGCQTSEVYQSSTGVIGEPLPEEKMFQGIDRLKEKLGTASYSEAASAIMTTDTYPKMATRSCMIDGETITLNGIAKGSGMIAPDMATMLAYLFTDLPIEQKILQKLVSKAIDKTFNCITVDGDTSTSDTVLVFATGKANISPITDEKDSRLRAFNRILNKQLKELALAIVKDGEGISKFVTIKVRGAKGKRAAKKIGLSIANSPLVKTAIAGEDPNWGRIIMAVGKSGEAADRDKLNIWIGGHQVTAEGARIEGYDETPLAEYMKGETILIEVDIGLGRGIAEIWTCDLTHDYISINADYRS
ncbi:MAG: bifunctional glutamate N-acetyltransferase/amino-acid acetyltransferase ArgJ [Hyphomicrobiales bacterium]